MRRGVFRWSLCTAYTTPLITAATGIGPLAVGRYTYCVLPPLLAPPVRRWLKRYVWLSFAAGFGQSVGSVLTSLGVLAVAAVFIHWQIAGAAGGGRYPAGVFSAFGAGIGILVAQAVLVRVLEREPKIREIIEA